MIFNFGKKAHNIVSDAWHFLCKITYKEKPKMIQDTGGSVIFSKFALRMLKMQWKIPKVWFRPHLGDLANIQFRSYLPTWGTPQELPVPRWAPKPSSHLLSHITYQGNPRFSFVLQQPWAFCIFSPQQSGLGGSHAHFLSFPKVFAHILSSLCNGLRLYS